jgi:hypothetical protein
MPSEQMDMLQELLGGLVCSSCASLDGSLRVAVCSACAVTHLLCSACVLLT